LIYNKDMIFSGQIVDVIRKKIFGGQVHVENGRILEIVETISSTGPFILPGFIDSHVHMESSMLTPAEFGRTVIPHGTIAVLNDPHEIANVCGVEGVKYMIENSRTTPMKYFFGAPSCVPATRFETSGAILGTPEISELLMKPDIYFLSEVMNYPAVLAGEAEIMEKIRLAKFYHKKIDGHAPGLKGKSLIKYITAGITTDHECTSIGEARDRIRLGMKIQIRQGSAAKNFEALMPLIEEYPEECMLCSDDRHPSDLFIEHMEGMVRRAVASGISIWNVLQAACSNPVFHYSLPVGLLQVGDPADFIVVNNLHDFAIQTVVINGEIVYEEGTLKFPLCKSQIINHFDISELSLEDIQSPADKKTPIIVVNDGQIITERMDSLPPEGDLLKIVSINRYQKSKPAIAYIHGFGLQQGAIGSSVAHDSHNILAVGTNDIDILSAVNCIIKSKGGVVACSKAIQAFLPLPVAGLMSDLTGEAVHDAYQKVEDTAIEFGSTLTSPLMTLSFMALLVIPKLKLSDKGLFDVDKFAFII
jgi:adenine deaminase